MSTRYETPAVILNPYYTAIGIARNLAPSGIRCVGVASTPDTPGANLKYFSEIVVLPDPLVAEFEFLDTFIAFLQTLPVRPIVYPTRDFDVEFINRHREKLAPYLQVPQTTAEIISRVADKDTLLVTAERAGLETPQSSCCGSEEEILEAAVQLTFPLILKPKHSSEWRTSPRHREIVGHRKVIVVADESELRTEYDRVKEITSEVLLQSFVPGEDHQIVIWGGYVASDGEISGYFTARKIRQSPPLSGTGCAVVLEKLVHLDVLSRALLNAADYTGFAEIEYKQHPQSGSYVIIEVNTRPWDQHELGRLAGVNLALSAYHDLVLDQVDRIEPDYRKGGVWIAEQELFFQVIEQIRQKLRQSDHHGFTATAKIALSEIRSSLGLFKHPVIFGIYSRPDWRLGIKLLAGIFKKLFLRAR